jgi:subtilisin family serine protease
MPSRRPLGHEVLERRACPAVVTLSPGFEIGEADPPQTLTVSLDGPATKPVTVSYVLTGTATPGADFRLLLNGQRIDMPIGRLTFQPGEVHKQIVVSPVNDSIREGDESLTMTLRPMGGVTIANPRATVTIIDNDTYDVQIVPLTASGQLEPGRLNEFAMRLVRRGEPVPATRTERFYVSTRDGTGIAGADYLPLDRLPVTFGPGQTEQRFRISVLSNPLDANGQFLKFENVFRITTEPFDPSFTTPQEVNVTVIGRERPLPGLRVIGTSRPEGNEGLTPFVFTVQLDDAPARAVSVTYATADGTATVADNDYIPASGVLEFGIGERSKTVSVFVVGDRHEERDETFSLVLSNPVNATILPGEGVGIATIQDDDRGRPLPDPGLFWQQDYGWGVIDASAAVAKVLKRETAFPEVTSQRDVDWANNIIGAPSVWAQGYTGQGITVAVIDSGVDYNHPALSRSYAGGWDFVDSDNDPMDDVLFVTPGIPHPKSGHGTHVAGTIVAAPNRYGPAGVAYGASLQAFRALAGDGRGIAINIANAILDAKNRGAHVINLSLGFDQYVPIVEAAIREAVASEVVVIISAGNDRGLLPAFPASLADLPGVISVGAIDRNEAFAGDFSNQAGRRQYNHLVAPGVAILSTFPSAVPVGPLRDPFTGNLVTTVEVQQGGKYAALQGTSMAAPHVAGVAALMLSALPNPRADGVSASIAQALIGTARRPAGAPAVAAPGLAGNLPAAASRPSVDLTGNGIADLIWQSTDGVTVAWLDGNPNTTRVLGGGGGWNIAVTGDFNGDGVSDLVWRNSSGQYVMWLMNAAGGSTRQQFLGGGNGWSLEATGDYNGDGKTDIVWRNGNNGVNVAWLMNGTVAAEQRVLGGSADWRLVPTEERFDANGDNRTDLIWRQAATGANVIWMMDGGTVINTRVIGGDRNWQIVAAGDYDGDGKGDVLWRNAANGGVVMHILDNGVVRESRFVGGDLSRNVVATTASATGSSAVFWRDFGGAIEQQFLAQGSQQPNRRLGGNAVWRLLGRPGQAA